MEQVIFKHEVNKYKLTLFVGQVFNDYRENCIIAKLRLYTLDNLLIESENYLFPVKYDRFNSILSGFDFFLDHIQSRRLPPTLAYNLYLKALNNGSDLAKTL